MKLKFGFNDVKQVLKESIQIFAFLHLSFTYGYSFSICTGPSMLPTISESGNIVLIDHFSYVFLNNEYKKGDVVVCLSPNDRRKNICKRIVATEGDLMPISTRYFPFQEFVIIPKGHVWLAGDNPNNSTDSRQYGPVSMGLLRGKVFMKFQPNLSQPFVSISNEIFTNGKQEKCNDK